MNKKLQKLVFIGSAVAFVVGLASLTAWYAYFREELLELPADYSYSAEVISYDNLYDEESQQFTGETRSQTTFSYEAVGEKDGTVEVKNTFDVRTINNEPIFSVNRLYGIDHESRQHVKGSGDMDRTGYLFAPPNNDKNDFIYWHVNYNQPLTMKFQETEDILGLETHHYITNFVADQTNELTNLPEVGKTRGISLDVTLELWVEPNSGELVKYQDNATAYYYNLKTKQRQNPWNQFRNSYSFDAIAQSVARAESQKQRILLVSEIVPILLASVVAFSGGLFVALLNNYKRWCLYKQTVFCVAVVIFVASITLLAWLPGEVALIAPLSLGSGMHYATGLVFLLLAFSTIDTARFVGKGVRIKKITNYIIYSCIFVALMNIAATILNGRALFTTANATMSIATSIAFILVSVGLLILRFELSGKLWHALLRSTVWAVIGLSAISLLGLSYEFPVVQQASWIRAMSLPTTFTFLMLELAIYPLTKNKSSKTKVLSPKQVALLFFIIPILLLGVLWRGAKGDVQRNVNLQFENEVNKIEGLITQRLNSYTNLLLGANSLISASEEVTRDEWKAYVDGLQLAKNYPGNQGVGYAAVLKPSEIGSFEEDVRAEGFEDFAINPAKPSRDIYTSILFLEPFDERNQRAFGFDMFTEQTRNAAMRRARDTGEAALSGKVTLLQETNDDVQAGFLIYTPVYKKNVPISTNTDRAENIEGYVYSPVRMDNFMQAAIGDQTSGVNVEVFDASSVNEINEENRMFGAEQEASNLPNKTSIITVDGHTWALRYSALPLYVSNTTERFPDYVLVGGIVASGLLAAAVFSLASSRRRAYDLAETITADLRTERNAAVKTQKKDDAILASIGEGLIATDSVGKIEFLNDKAQKMLKLQGDDCNGKKLIHIVKAYNLQNKPISQKERPAFIAFKEQRVVNKRLNYERSDGTFVPVEITVAPIIQSGKVVGLIEVFRDISSELELESAKDDFMSIVSHQLNTPATAVKQFLGLVLEGYFGKVPAKQRELIEKAYNNNEEQINIIQDLLTTARIEAGKSKLEFQEVQLHGLLEQIIQPINMRATQNNVKIELKVPKDAKIHADKTKLRMCLSNLIDNAVKYNKKNGTVTVSTKEMGSYLGITVADTGIGIKPADISKLFNRFTRVAETSDKQIKGNGLGLYLVKKIAKMHKGDILVESKYGSGTTFTVKLPRKGKQ